MANNGADWKLWGAKLGIGFAALLLSVTLALAAYSFTSMKSQLSVDVARIETALAKHLESELALASSLANKLDTRFDALCKQVGDQGVLLKEHDLLLRQPWPQRKEFYLYQKNRLDR